MAGIGFELRKTLKKKSLTNLLKVYGTSILLSSGPWIIAVLSIFLIAIMSKAYGYSFGSTIKLQVIITYIMGISLIFTGFMNYSFSRYIADVFFEKKYEKVMPEFNGAVLVIMLSGLIFILIFDYFFLNGIKSINIILFSFSFILLSSVWILNIYTSAMKKYYYILFVYFFSFSIMVILSVILGKFNLTGFLFSFFTGVVVLFFSLQTLIVQNFPSDKLISFEFLNKKKFYFSYAFIGLFYNAGLWIDKFVFWFNPETSYPIYANLNASFFYDIPIFFSYLTIIPGMGIFFFRLEVDFAEKFDYFYNAVRAGTLEEIWAYKNMMASSIRKAIRETIVLQGIISLIIVSFAEQIFNFLNLPLVYLSVFYICVVGAQLQLGVMAMFTFLFYLDRRKEALILTIVLFVLNFLFAEISIYLGPYFYGYGYTTAMLIVFTLNILVLKKIISEIDYETFMLQ